MGPKLGAQNVLGTACMTSVTGDSQGWRWTGTDRDGLYLQDDKFQVVKHFKENFPATILGSCEDNKGNIWIGSFKEGCGWIDRKTMTYHPYPLPQGADISIFDVICDRQGRIWLASMGYGVLRLNPETGEVKAYVQHGKAQEDRTRYASFLATTNDPHPLCDTTGSRRYLCLRIKKGSLIDNTTPINYDQLYAQVLHELRNEQTPYWFNNDEVARIQSANLPFFKTDDMEGILQQCFRLPSPQEDGEWLTCRQVGDALLKVYPTLKRCNGTNVRIGQTLKYLGCQTKHTKWGVAYKLMKNAA